MTLEDWFIGCMNNWTVGRAGNKTITFTPYTCTPSHSSPNSSEKLRASREAQRKATHNEGTVEGGEGGGEWGEGGEGGREWWEGGEGGGREWWRVVDELHAMILRVSLSLCS